MIYEVDTKKLHLNNDEVIKLSKIQHKLLICLSSNNVVDYKSIIKYIDTNNINIVKLRLFEKTNYNLEIKTIVGYGLKLESKIYFTWKGDL